MAGAAPSSPIHDGDLDLAEAPTHERVGPPPLFKVLLLNDDFTPMDYVVEVLTRHFGMAERQAEQVMWAVHHEGKGIAGVFTRDVAETKVTQVNRDAQRHGHPLKTAMEEA